MSRIWYLVILLAVVLIVWIVAGNIGENDNGKDIGDDDPPHIHQTVGFDTIQVNSRLIAQLYGVTDSVKGFRVYNALLDGRNNVGLVVAALDRDSSEIFDDGQSFYIPVNKEGDIMATITRDLAERMVKNLLNHDNYRNFISSFYANSLNEFWSQGTPDLIWLAPTVKNYNRDTAYQNLEIVYDGISDSGDFIKISINGSPCPNYCPFNPNPLINPEKIKPIELGLSSNNEDDDGEEDNGDSNNNRNGSERE